MDGGGVPVSGKPLGEYYVTQSNAFSTRWGLDSRLALWLTSLFAGFLYVSGFVNGRENPLLSRDGNYVALTELLLVGAVLYLLGPRKAFMPWGSAPRAEVLRNYLLFLVPLAVGLQFYYGQRIDAINYSLTARSLSHAGPAAWIVIAALCLALAGLCAWNIWLARREGYALAYAGTLVAALSAIPVVTFLLRDSHYLHIHHYNVFGFFLPWLRFRHPVTLVALGLCTGIFIEGVTTWGMDAMWIPR